MSGMARMGRGIARATACLLLAGAAAAQEGGGLGLDLTPPDMSAPAAEREHRTCPDREPPPAWTEGLEGWEFERSRLLSAIQQARSFEAIIATGDCSCAVKAPPWDEAEAVYMTDYAMMDLQAIAGAADDHEAAARGMRRDVRALCVAQDNW